MSTSFPESNPCGGMPEPCEGSEVTIGDNTKPLYFDVVKDSKLAPPVSVYQEIRGRAYGTDYFGVKDDMAEVEGYVNEKILSNKLRDTQESYEVVVDAILRKIGVVKNESNTSKFTRVKDYVQKQNRLNELKQEQDTILDLLGTKQQLSV